MQRLDWSVQQSSVGAALLGAGLGILLALALPEIAPWWPLGLVLSGVLLWRQPSERAVPLALLGAALALAAFAAPVWGRAAGRAVTLESSPAQQALWQQAQHVVVRTRVGSVRVLGPLPDGEAVLVRATYRGGAAPAEVQADYDPVSRTLSITGTDSGGAGSGDLVFGAPDLAADIELRLPAAVSLSARTGTGAITIALEQPLSAALDAETELGDVSLTLSAGSDASVQAISGLRQFEGRLERVTATERRLTLGSGQHQVSLRAGIGRVEVRTR